MIISDVCDISRAGYVSNTELVSGEKYTFLENSPEIVIHSQKYDVIGKNITSTLRNGDIMFGNLKPDGTRFSAVLSDIEENTISNQKNVIIRPLDGDQKVITEFVKLVLDSNFAQDWVDANTDDGKNYLTVDVFSQFPFPKLSIEKQKVAAQDKIESDVKIDQINQKISELQQEIDSAYTDIIGQGYDVTLFDRVRFKDGKTFKDTELSQDGKYSIITKASTDAKKPIKTINYSEMVKSDLSTERKVIPLKSKDLILRVGGSQKRAYLLDGLVADNVVTSNEFLTIVPKLGDRDDITTEGGATAKFVAFALNSQESQDWIKNNFVTEPGDGARRTISKAILSYMPFPSISIHEQNNVMDDIDDKKNRIENLIGQTLLLRQELNDKYHSIYGNSLPSIEVVPKRIFESHCENKRLVIDKMLNKADNINELSMDDNSVVQNKCNQSRLNPQKEEDSSFAM